MAMDVGLPPAATDARTRTIGEKTDHRVCEAVEDARYEHRRPQRRQAEGHRLAGIELE